MNKICIILNYGNSIPPFLSNIILHLQKRFKLIFLLSKDISEEDMVSYQNSSIKFINIKQNKNCLYICSIIFNSIPNIIKMMKEKRFSIKAALDILKLNNAAQLLVDECKEIIDHNNTNEISMLAVWFWAEALAAAKIKKKYDKIKTVSLAHSFEVDMEKNKVFDLGYIKLKHKYLDNIIFISRNMMNIYIQSIKEHISLSNLCVLYLGSNKLFHNSNSKQEKDVFQIVSCSRVEKVKRVYLILEAIKLIGNKKIEWTHYGDGSMMKELKKQMERKIPDNLIINLKGEMSNEEIQKNYATKNYDLFLNVSTSEGVPVAIMEAMSYGIPVMATDVGGNNEIVPSNAGMLLPKELTAKMLADQILNFANMSDEKHLYMKHEAEKIWKEKFNAKENLEKIVDFLV